MFLRNNIRSASQARSVRVKIQIDLEIWSGVPPSSSSLVHRALASRPTPSSSSGSPRYPCNTSTSGSLSRRTGCTKGSTKSGNRIPSTRTRCVADRFGRLATSFVLFFLLSRSFSSSLLSSFRSSDSDGLTKPRVFVAIHSFWTNWNRSCLRAGSSSIGIRATSILSAGPTWSSSYGAITPHSGTD